jgi:hypothetical protein
MYRCCACEKPVAWYRASGASPWFPHACASCGVEQHRPHFGFAYVVAGALITWTAPLAMFLLAVTGNLGIAAVVLSALLLWLLWAEERSYRAGRLVPTTASQKRNARIAVAAVLLPMLTAVTWFVFSAGI